MHRSFRLQRLCRRLARGLVNSLQGFDLAAGGLHPGALEALLGNGLRPAGRWRDPLQPRGD